MFFNYICQILGNRNFFNVKQFVYLLGVYEVLFCKCIIIGKNLKNNIYKMNRSKIGEEKKLFEEKCLEIFLVKFQWFRVLQLLVFFICFSIRFFFRFMDNFEIVKYVWKYICGNVILFFFRFVGIMSYFGILCVREMKKFELFKRKVIMEEEFGFKGQKCRKM